MPQQPLLNGARRKPIRYEAVQGYFEQSDPGTDGSAFPLIPVALGLVDKSESRWEKTFRRLRVLQEKVGKKGVVKLLFLQRHGQGEHNVAEAKYGKEAWDSYYSKLPFYFDASLTPLGISQLAQNADNLFAEINEHKLALPSLIVTSPLSRCLNTTRLVWGKITQNKYDPKAIEFLREQYGDHTCDQRRTRTELSKRFPEVDFTDLVTDEDSLWEKDVREPDEHVIERVRAVFDGLFSLPETSSGETLDVLTSEKLIGIVCHGGIIESSIHITGHRDFPVPPGGMLPMVVIGWFE
ncbi:histidine phosphatase superfamily [Fimicolochytrium jonesii]|uniref:histidine phosphatase superfamily n=1 Tax=Fimicolochytrium jonesii TaxID=1396493 RepID=UPI0022FDB3EC|nr:histidine phosphatase superfamily [Fimicolochytrium jonesii]KAI8818639.1 histidine phosphatase superfamily [Fimicolochytrium jonesii]